MKTKNNFICSYTFFFLDDSNIIKFIVFFSEVLVDIDMQSTLFNQILVKIFYFVFIINIEFEKLSLFYSSCKKDRVISDDFMNNTVKPLTVLSKPVVNINL